MTDPKNPPIKPTRTPNEGERIEKGATVPKRPPAKTVIPKSGDK